MAIKKAYDVTGMHCGKCVARVKDAIEALDGVRAAKVTLDPGAALVKMDEDIADDVIIAAVEAEGFGASAAASEEE
ncbi:MAG: heavy-metal-associated domain-containing protein [Eggerthellaceae bacterium]|nr:heavy-metal-associated domain-containing protein [Eggerthellaceae bacterium]